MRKFIVAAALVMTFLMFPAWGQGVSLYACSQKKCSYDWNAIRECAKQKYPKANGPHVGDPVDKFLKDYDDSQTATLMFQQTNLCRMILAARHEGWLAATDKPDPIPPEPEMREDDFK